MGLIKTRVAWEGEFHWDVCHPPQTHPKSSKSVTTGGAAIRQLYTRDEDTDGIYEGTMVTAGVGPSSAGYALPPPPTLGEEAALPPRPEIQGLQLNLP